MRQQILWTCDRRSGRQLFRFCRQGINYLLLAVAIIVNVAVLQIFLMAKRGRRSRENPFNPFIPTLLILARRHGE